MEAIWSVMCGQRAMRECATPIEVFRRPQAIKDALVVEVVNAFVLSFGRGLELLIQVGGNSLSPLLSAQVRVPRAVQIRRGGVRVFREEEDAVLRYAV